MKTSRLASPANPSGSARTRAYEPAFPAGDPISRSCGTAWRFLAVAFAYCALAFAASVFAANVSWNRNAESDIVRYEVHFGTSPGTVARTINAGNQASVAVNDLEPGVTYYITVTAVNEAGLVSEPSAEISYQEPLADVTLVPQSTWTLRYVDSEEGGNYAAVKAFDGNASTFWHTRWTGGGTGQPHEIQIDLGAVHPVEGFRYLPRQDNFSVGIIVDYQFYTSLDGVNWGSAAASGSFSNNSSEKQVLFTNRNTRYVKLVCLSAANGGPDCSVAEINLLQGNAIGTPENLAPAADSKSISLVEDGSTSATLSGSDPDGGSLTFAVVSGPSHGALSGTPPSLTYTPSANYSGTDSFTYKANDGSLDSPSATVSITVTAVNDAPVAVSKSVTTTEDTAVSVALTASDVEGSALTYSIVNGPAKGALSGTAPNLTFTPNANANGSDSFTYRATDGSANSNTATVSITINAVNDAPIAVSKSVTSMEDTAVSVVLSASDVEGSSLTYSLVGGPSKGVLSGTSPNLIYTPNTNFNGSDSFTYRATDGSANSNTATISITVTSVNDAPIADTKSVTTAEDTAVSVVLTASDVEGSSLTYSIVGGPSKGAVSGTAPNLTFTPNANFNGSDSFTYRATDGSANSNTATVSIIITALNDAPVANSQTVTVRGAKPASIALSATDVESASLTYVLESSPSHGTLAGTPPNLTYTAAAGYSGADSFTFKASDGRTYSNTATVAITVTPELNAGDIIPNSGWSLLFTDSEETPNYQAIHAFDGNPDTFWHTRFTSNATALPHEIQIRLGGLHELTGFRYLPRQDSLLVGNFGTFEFHTSMDGATWGLAASGSFANDHELKEINFPARNARFVRLVCLTEASGSVYASMAEIDLLGIALPNSSPTAADLAFACNAGSSCSLTLDGDDPDGDSVTYSIVQTPAHGTLSGTGSSLIYQPEADFTGEDSFVYAVSDGILSTQASVIIRVSSKPGGGNRPPVFKMDPIRAAAAIERRTYAGQSLDEIASDSDAGDVIRFSKTSGPEWLKVSASGKLSGTPPSGANGIHRFKVTATDKAGASSDADLIVEIQRELPLPWDVGMLGAVRDGDAVRNASGSLVLTGGGDLSGPSDAGTFVWQTLSGDGQVVARVTSLEQAGSDSRAGIMIRDSLAPKSAHAFLGINGGGDFRWIHRARTGAPSKHRQIGKGSPPATWVKLVRDGDKVTAFKSRNGEDWTRVGSATVDLGKNCYIGLMVSGGGNKQAIAAFRDVRIKP